MSTKTVAWSVSKKTILALAAELVRGTDCMGDDDTELVLEVRMPGTVRNDDGSVNAEPVLAISDAEYPEEGVYPIDPHNPTAGREQEAQQQAEESQLLRQARQLVKDIEAQQQADPGVYAILYRDNWDGEGDTYHTLATRLDNGAWLDHESGASLLKYEGDAILRVWPLTDDKAQQQADPVARDVIAKLVALTRAVNIALDDSEERDGIDGREHVIGSVNFDAVCDALEALEELPDNKPGWAMNAADKAEWALRHLTDAAQPPAVAVPVPGEWRKMVEAAIVALKWYADVGHVETLSGKLDWPAEREKLKAKGFRCEGEHPDGTEVFVEYGDMAAAAVGKLGAMLAAAQKGGA